MTEKTRTHDPHDWHRGLFAGNGKQGLTVYGEADDEILVYQHMDLVLPTREPRFTPPEVRGQLEEARQSVLRFDDDWDIHHRNRTFLYPFHPGMQLHAVREDAPERRGEMRPDSGEIVLRDPAVSERHFVSVIRDAVFSEFTSSGDEYISLDLFPSLPEEMPGFHRDRPDAPEAKMKFRFYAGESHLALFCRYHDYENSDMKGCGFLTVVKIAQNGSVSLSWEEDRPCLSIRDARKITLIGATVPLSGLAEPDALFAGPAEALVKEVLAGLDALFAKVGADYTAALAEDLPLRRDRDGRNTLAVPGDSGDEGRSLAELLAKQKSSSALNGELLSRLYRLSRYVLSSAGTHTAPRLCGLWTGQWYPGWNGYYTMDANVNIQISGMNAGNLPEAAQGYFRFLSLQLDDWRENAALVYGMTDAVLCPVNTDGRRAVMVEYDIGYPFEYWNAGAAWMLNPLFEAWQCYGDLPLMWDGAPEGGLAEGLLRPLLRMTLNFWRQLLTPEYFTDAAGKARYERGKTRLENGEHYLILPGYSPENHPAGRCSPLAMNTAMDIAAAHDTIRMARLFETAKPQTKQEGESILSWDSGKILALCDELEAGLPLYLTDESGALKEWAYPGYRENNEHRHVSHLYCAWPGFETNRDPALHTAAVRALENRRQYNVGKDDTASHGWIHRLLALARLGERKSLAKDLLHLVSSDVFYDNGMTDHNLDRRLNVFCTDTLLGLGGIIQEMLVYSDSNSVELLHALPPEWKAGSFTGLRTRCGLILDRLDWDLDVGIVTAECTAWREMETKISLGLPEAFENQDRGSRKFASGERLVLTWISRN